MVWGEYQNSVTKMAVYFKCLNIQGIHTFDTHTDYVTVFGDNVRS